MNETYPFAGLWSDSDELLPDKHKSKTTLSSSLSSSRSVLSSSASSLPSSSAVKETSSTRLGVESPANRVQRIKDTENGNKNSDEVHVIPEQPEDPCVVSGRVDVTHNWFGYLGVFHLRRSETPLALSSSPARMYYRVIYPSGRVPVSLLFYLGEQVRSLNVRMNCFQRVQLVDQRGPQVIRLDPTVPHSGCVNRSRTPADGDIRSRDDRRTGGGGGGKDSSTSGMVIDCRGGRVLRSNVERQWNVAVSSCGSPRGLTLTYTVAVYGHIGKCPSSPGLSGVQAVTWSSPDLLLLCIFSSVISSSRTIVL